MLGMGVLLPSIRVQALAPPTTQSILLRNITGVLSYQAAIT